jgi:hypothetical protein
MPLTSTSLHHLQNIQAKLPNGIFLNETDELKSQIAALQKTVATLTAVVREIAGELVTEQSALGGLKSQVQGIRVMPIGIHGMEMVPVTNLGAAASYGLVRVWLP